MNSDQRFNPDRTVGANNHAQPLRSNPTNSLPALQSLTSNRASNGEFVNNVLAREQRIQALLGVAYSLLSSRTIEPSQTKNQLFNLAYPKSSRGRHDLIQRTLITTSSHPLSEVVHPNQNITKSHALQPILRKLSLEDIKLHTSTSQVAVPLYQEESDVTAGNKSNNTSISQYLRNYLNDRQRLNDASSFRESSSSMSPNLIAMRQEARGKDNSISQYLRSYSTNRQRILSDTPVANELNLFMAPNSSGLEHGNSDRLQVPTVQCHDMVAHSSSLKLTTGLPTAFPQTLYQLLSDLEMQAGGSAIASFLPHGCGFAIYKRKEFTTDVMPKYFDMGSFTSFRRQLKMYNFQQIQNGPEKGSYYHKLFVRGRPQMLAGIKRTNNKR